MKRFFGVAALLAATFSFSQSAHTQSSTRSGDSWRVFPVSSLQKLTAKSDGVLLPFATKRVELQAARGEWQSFQVVVSADEKPLRFTVAPTSFATTLGQFITRENVQIFRENFVRVSHPSGNRVLESRFWPDALLPVNDKAEIAVEAHRSVVFWVAVHVPRQSEAGQYFAALNVVAQGETPRELALALRVSPAVLPTQTMRANVALYYDVLRDWYAKNLSPLDDKDFAQMKRNYYDFLLDYGLNAYDLPVGWNSDEAAAYLRDNRVLGVRLPPQDAPDFEVALAQLKRTNTLQKAYDYRIDEPAPEQYQNARDATSKLHLANAQLKQVVTIAPNNSLRDSVDIWCPNIGDFFGLGHLDLEELGRERKRGRETWFYTMVEPKAPYPTWLLDDDASAVRVYGWMMARENISGFVYSMAHGWGAQPLQNLESFEGTNGDGTLLYPGDLTGDTAQKLRPMPSIRLMILREAIQDYELLRALPESKRRALIEYSIDDSLLFPDANRAHFTETFESQRARLLALSSGENVEIPRVAIPRRAWPHNVSRLEIGTGTIPFVSAAPKIDGQLNDAIWNERARFRGQFARLENAKEKWPTTKLWIAHDAKFLYLAIRANEAKRAGAIAIEIAPLGGSERWRFVASASGKTRVERHTREGHFQIEETDTKIVRRNFPAQKQIEYSNLEMAIPRKLIGNATRFRLNAWRRIWRDDLQLFYTTRAMPDANDTTRMPIVVLTR